MSSYTFRLPDLGEGVAEGEIARWLVAVGQEVAEDDPLVEIETDKTTVEIPSPVAGPVSQILVEAGSVVPVGTALVVIGDGAVEPAPATAGQASGPVQATPLVRRMAQELGVELASVRATGPGGRITEEDVRLAAGGGKAASATGGRREPLSAVRRRIAERLSRAQREVPAVTVVEECDYAALQEVRGERSLPALVLRAVAASLLEYRELNATLDGEHIVYWDRLDLGLAVQTERGLLVPVVTGVGERDVAGLDAELARLAEGAREGTLAPEELRGSTFTVTSAGKLGGLFATPLVNHPEVAILGVHRIADRPVVRDGQIVVRPIGLLSCTFDHRVVDGARASAFLLDVIHRLQAPDSLVR
jgi:pyruvate/2-oxoglutarate dehydrogenase complex dihydrolipoamide acyltransferase (E2) component